jgi:hypothetical protein
VLLKTALLESPLQNTLGRKFNKDSLEQGRESVAPARWQC